LESFQHQLQKFDPGIIWLDKKNYVMALNTVAVKVLGSNADKIIGTELLNLHPEKSRAKIAWLLEAARCSVEEPPPQTMMINIPDRVLLIKVSKMEENNEFFGTCMVFYDLTETITEPRKVQQERDGGKPRLLFKIPVYHLNTVMLIDLKHVVYLKADGHYTNIYTEQGGHMCNLSLADLEGRLDTQQFVRTHRSYMINIRYASAFEKVNENFVISLLIKDVARIPVSRGNVQKLKQMLGLA